jgi:hypothetical protein
VSDEYDRRRDVQDLRFEVRGFVNPVWVAEDSFHDATGILEPDEIADSKVEIVWATFDEPPIDELPVFDGTQVQVLHQIEPRLAIRARAYGLQSASVKNRHT